MPAYSPTAKERAMKMREVLLQALAGKMSWIQAADVLGLSARTVRRWREKFEESGVDGLLDGRRRSPSDRAIPARELTQWLRLYRERYVGYNVRHFHSLARRKHGLKWSYSLMRNALQIAGLVGKRRPRGKHRMRREPRPCFGEMLHLDGSRHRWLALVPDQWLTLIAVVDDATKRLLYAEVRDGGESVGAIMTALHAVLTRYGLPMALHTDRAHWAVHTPVAGGAPDRRRLTQVGRALARLGIEHILGYSPAARGRSERVNPTLQDRLVNELRLAGITTVPAANRYLRERFLPAFNDEFVQPPPDPAPPFGPPGRVDLEQILCVEEERVVGRDHVVTPDRLALQLAKQPGRRTCAGLRVLIRRHLSGHYSVWYGARCLGRYDGQSRARRAA